MEPGRSSGGGPGLERSGSVVLRETNFLLFLAASLPLIMTPGPDMIYVATHGFSRGHKVALLSALGVGLGYVVHAVLAVAGLSALLQGSATAFLEVKYVGAAYLLYLGFRALFDRGGFSSLRGEGGGRTDHLARVFFRGTVTSVLNPKGVLFFMAFLPQFVNLGGGSVALQVCVLGSIFAMLCLIVYGLVGYFFGSLGDVLIDKPRFAGALRWATGGILVALGLRLAIPEPC